MPVVEIIAGVAATVQAFNSSVTLYRSWRDKRRERRDNTQNQNLERSLTAGETTVQREYNGHFARLGPRFAVGDDRARAELAEYVVKLQHAFMTMMAESNSPLSLVLPSMPAIYSTSENTRMGVVSALAQLYQRMEQARPLSGSYGLASPSEATTWPGVPPVLRNLAIFLPGIGQQPTGAYPQPQQALLYPGQPPAPQVSPYGQQVAGYIQQRPSCLMVHPSSWGAYGQPCGYCGRP